MLHCQMITLLAQNFTDVSKISALSISAGFPSELHFDINNQRIAIGEDRSACEFVKDSRWNSPYASCIATQIFTGLGSQKEKKLSEKASDKKRIQAEIINHTNQAMREMLNASAMFGNAAITPIPVADYPAVSQLSNEQRKTNWIICRILETIFQKLPNISEVDEIVFDSENPTVVLRFKKDEFIVRENLEVGIIIHQNSYPSAESSKIERQLRY